MELYKFLRARVGGENVKRCRRQPSQPTIKAGGSTLSLLSSNPSPPPVTVEDSGLCRLYCRNCLPVFPLSHLETAQRSEISEWHTRFLGFTIPPEPTTHTKEILLTATGPGSLILQSELMQTKFERFHFAALGKSGQYRDNEQENGNYYSMLGVYKDKRKRKWKLL